MKFHVITGLPRAGSTLLCNVLNQNPAFWATSTSSVPGMLSSVSNFWSNSIEVKNLLEKEKESTEKAMMNSMRGFVNEWHRRDDNREVIFDKSRGWTHHFLLLRKLYPSAKIIVTVRDLRAIFASVEKQHRKNPLVDISGEGAAKGIFQNADAMFSPNGMIGHCIEGIMDLTRRKPEGVIYVSYEAFSQNPGAIMARIYDSIGEASYTHDFNNVVNTANDCDGHYLHKYPHKGEGKIEPCNPNEWKEYLSPDLAQTIMNRFSAYNQLFGYV